MIETGKETYSENKKNPGAIAGIIIRRKIPNAVVYVLFYLFLCCGNWFSMRRTLAYVADAGGYNEFISSFIGNDAFAFVPAGILPLVLYELARLIAFGMFRFMGSRAVADMEYSLRIFYGLGYLVYGAFSLLYFAVPALSVYGETIVRFLIVGAAVGLYTLFEARYRMPARLVPRSVYAFCGVYCLINLVFALYSLISELIMW